VRKGGSHPLSQADFLRVFAADIRHLQELWNLAQPDQFAQNGLNQVQRFSVTNEGPAVAVGETVNSDPAAWVHNCGPSGCANNLSKAVFAQFGQAGYGADPSKYTAPTPGMQVAPSFPPFLRSLFLLRRAHSNVPHLFSALPLTRPAQDRLGSMPAQR